MDDIEARRVLTDHGERPPRKGRLSNEWRLKATHYADQDAGLAATGPAPEPDTYDGDVTEADYPDSPPPGGEAPPVVEEQRPRRVKGTTLPPLWGRARRDKTKRKHPRVPVDRLVGRVWEMFGGLAGRVDVPLGRCLEMQAPVAGLILEDVVKGTVVDTVLQPVARAEEKAEKVLALAAPPLIVLGLEAAQGLPDDQRRIREAILVPMLEEAMVLWVKVAGDKIEAKAARDAEDAPARERAQHLMSLIFAPPPGGAATADDTEPAAA